ncbi:hypothetical protein LTR53_013169 [Teratosphaeriaceae sp. CCFEE 6253]|nr:hypothetical protein LTR53_013169 [Teratosphaeriaceae sp. CCFEE 6253]
MRLLAVAGMALLLSFMQTVSTWDMFQTISPGHDSLAPLYNATTSTLSSTTLSMAISTSKLGPSSTVIDVQAECTLSGLVNDCIPLNTAAPTHSADASAVAIAKGVENALWFIAFGSSLLLLATGKVEAVALLLLLTVAKAKSESIPTHATVGVDLATTAAITGSMSYVTALTTDMPLPTGIDEKAQCWQTISGLLYPSACVTHYFRTMAPVVVPAPGSGAVASAATRAVDTLVHTVSLQASCMAFLLTDPLWGSLLMALCFAISAAAEQVVATPVLSTTSGELPRDQPLVTSTPAALPNATMAEKGVVCYATYGGLASPTPCPVGWSPPQPTPTPRPGETFEQFGNAASVNRMGHGISVLPLAILAYHLDLIDRKMLALLLLRTVMNVRVQASPQDVATLRSTSTATRTVTVYYALTNSQLVTSDPRHMVQNTATVTALPTAVRDRGTVACSAVYGMQNCPLPYTPPVATNAAATMRPIGLRNLNALWPFLLAGNAHATSIPSVADAPPLSATVTTAAIATAVGLEGRGTCPGFYGPESCPFSLGSDTATVSVAAKVTETCAGFYGPQGCMLFQTPASAFPNHTSSARGDKVLVLFVSAALTRTVSPRMLYALWLLLAAYQARAQLPNEVSIPLPQFAVDTTATPSVTVTQLFFVQNADVHFTPTVTQYIALCTPYCSRLNTKGQCAEVKGCQDMVTSGCDEAIVKHLASMSTWMSMAFVVGLLFGVRGWVR